MPAASGSPPALAWMAASTKRPRPTGPWKAAATPTPGRATPTVLGTRWQASERWKAYAENQQHWGEREQGLSNVFGVTHKPAPEWTVGLDFSQSRLNRSQGDPTARYSDRVLRSDGLSAGSWLAAPTSVDRDGIGASLGLGRKACATTPAASSTPTAAARMWTSRPLPSCWTSPCARAWTPWRV